MKRLSGYRLRLSDEKGIRHEAVVMLGEGYHYDNTPYDPLSIELTPLFKEDGDDTRTLR